MAVEPLVGALVAIAVALVGVLSGVIAWLVRKLWKIKTEDVPEADKRIDTIEQMIEGTESTPGFVQDMRADMEEVSQEMEDLKRLVEDSQRRRQVEHEEVREVLIDIIEVLKEQEGINGRLPDKEELDD